MWGQCQVHELQGLARPEMGSPGALVETWCAGCGLQWLCRVQALGLGLLSGDRAVSGWQTQMHMEGMAAHQGLQRTSGTITEEGDQNKLDNSPSQVITANIWEN